MPFFKMLAIAVMAMSVSSASANEIFDLGAFMQSHNLGAFTATLKDAGVDQLDELQSLTLEDLKELGIPLAKRKKIVALAKTLQDADVSGKKAAIPRLEAEIAALEKVKDYRAVVAKQDELIAIKAALGITDDACSAGGTCSSNTAGAAPEQSEPASNTPPVVELTGADKKKLEAAKDKMNSAEKESVENALDSMAGKSWISSSDSLGCVRANGARELSPLQLSTGARTHPSPCCCLFPLALLLHHDTV
jgi:Skp family chaperone for outer membrane proteins